MRPHAGMRRRSRLLPILATAVLLAGCDSTLPATPNPSTPAQPSPAVTTAPSAKPSASPPVAPSAPASPTPSPAATPTTPPQAGEWPYRTPREITQTLFPADGRVVVVERDFDAERSAVVVLDAQGKPVDGWPWSIDTGNPIAVAALGPENSIYVAQRGTGTGGSDYSWKLHRLSSAAAEQPGFPIDLPPVSFCALDASSSGVAYVTCESEDADGRVAGTVFSAVSPDGASPFAAPVRLGRSATLAGFGPDGLPILAIDAPGRTVVRALAADGTTRWSTRAIAGSAFVDPQGRVRVTRQDFGEDACGTPLRTTYDLIGADGRHASGWPVVLRGWASGPEVLDDGSMIAATASGQAFRYSLRGRVASGWPVRVDVSFSCYDGTQPVATAGRLVVVGGTRVTELGPHGATAWSTNPPGTIAIVCPGCTPGGAAPITPVLTQRSTYVGTYDAQGRPRVAVLGRVGAVGRRPIVGGKFDELLWLAGAPTGRIWAVTTRQRETTTSRLSLVGQEAPPAP